MALLLLALALFIEPPQPPGSTAANPSAAPASPAAAYVPERVYDTGRRAFSDFEAMLADLARADVVFVGEQHGDPNTHRLEAAVLQGLLRRGVPVKVSLEMFERDVQTYVNEYVAGLSPEEVFLRDSRPWPRYATDYRPLVEMAKAHRWSVIASNVPRQYASAVAKEGLTALDALPAGVRAFVARELICPLDAYFDRFAQTMNSHPAPGDEKLTDAERRARTERYYYSQCVKDETMAEAIAAAFEEREGRPGTIVHFTGSFHSDFGAGAAERTRRRLPGRRVAVVSILPVQDIDAVQPADEELRRAEYLVYTVK